MLRLLEIAAALLLLFVVVKFFRQTFRRTPPDDRMPPEDALVGAGRDNPNKPQPSSIKLDLPKDPD